MERFNRDRFRDEDGEDSLFQKVLGTLVKKSKKKKVPQQQQQQQQQDPQRRVSRRPGTSFWPRKMRA